MFKLSSLTFLLLIFNFQGIFSQVIETTTPLNVDLNKATIRTRFTPPKGFYWEKTSPGSFSEYLSNFPLYPKDFPIRDFNEVPIEQQKYHVAILKIDVGHRDLQQCADAWIRLYSEYLWAQKRFDEIGFEFTSGQFYSWNDYKNGLRVKEYKNRVKFIQTNKKDDSYESFRQYLVIIFRYAGTISLDRESDLITENSQIQTGDFIMKPGSPGHCVIIVGVARNNAGKKLYLLAESFMPAQDIHILVNRMKPQLSPWYELNVNDPRTITAKYIFEPTSIKRFHAIE